MKSEVAAVILTYNESSNIGSCIETLAWADRIIVFDSFSEDRTVQIAQQKGAEVIQSEFVDYAQQRNSALAQVASDWIFFVDADERGTQELGEEIEAVTSSSPERGWYVPRHNFIFGRLTLGGGWYPDYQLRLFKYGHVKYERPVHEIAVVDGQIGRLENPLLHLNYRDPQHFHEKQRAYIDLDISELHRQKVKPKIYTPFSQTVRQFWWRLVTLKGYRDGLHGLRLGGYLAYYEGLKYWRLRQIQG